MGLHEAFVAGHARRVMDASGAEAREQGAEGGGERKERAESGECWTAEEGGMRLRLMRAGAGREERGRCWRSREEPAHPEGRARNPGSMDEMWRGWMDRMVGLARGQEGRAARARAEEEAWVAIGEPVFQGLLASATAEYYTRRRSRFSAAVPGDRRFQGRRECDFADVCLELWRRVRTGTKVGPQARRIHPDLYTGGYAEYTRLDEDRSTGYRFSDCDIRFASREKDEDGTPNREGILWGFPCPWEGKQLERWIVLRRRETPDGRDPPEGGYTSGPMSDPASHPGLRAYVQRLSRMGTQEGELEDDRLRRACLARLWNAPTSRGGRVPYDDSHRDARGRAATPPIDAEAA
jgi:hypothetical protein